MGLTASDYATSFGRAPINLLPDKGSGFWSSCALCLCGEIIQSSVKMPAAIVTTSGHDRIGWRQLDQFLNRGQLVKKLLLRELKTRLNRAEGNRFSSRDFPLA